MRELNRRLLSTLGKFRRINMSALVPNLSYSEFYTLLTIDRCNRPKDVECQGHCADILRVGVDESDGENDACPRAKVSEISGHMNVNSTAVSRSLRSLEQKDYIVRTVSPKDRRITYVDLTNEGKAVLIDAEKAIDDYSEAVVGRLGEEDLNRLINYLNKLYKIADEELESRKERKEQAEENE